MRRLLAVAAALAALLVTPAVAADAEAIVDCDLSFDLTLRGEVGSDPVPVPPLTLTADGVCETAATQGARKSAALVMYSTDSKPAATCGGGAVDVAGTLTETDPATGASSSDPIVGVLTWAGAGPRWTMHLVAAIHPQAAGGGVRILTMSHEGPLECALKHRPGRAKFTNIVLQR